MTNDVETMTKQHLIDAVAESSPGLDATAVVSSILNNLQDALNTSGLVKISRFGKFTVKQTKARNGRNPLTGESIEIQARRVVKFHPSTVLRQSLNIIK